jgi:hypothetical protein
MRGGGGQAGGLTVERTQVGEVLVHETGDHEVVALGCQARLGHVRLDEPVVDVPGPGRRQHLGREVDAVDRRHPMAAQPRPRSAGTAAQVDRAPHRGPGRFGEPLEQRDVHHVLDGLLIRGRPFPVAGPYVHCPITTGIEIRKSRHVI